MKRYKITHLILSCLIKNLIARLLKKSSLWKQTNNLNFTTDRKMVEAK